LQTLPSCGQPLDILTTIIYGYHSLEQREATIKKLIERSNTLST
jgi:hypothetical protein